MIIGINLAIFDGTGDLTFRKLLLALCTMNITRKSPQDDRITIVDHCDYDNSHYRRISRDWVERFTRLSFEEEAFDRLSEKIGYYRMDLSRLEVYHGLNHYHRENDISSHIFYFAMASRFFNTVMKGLKMIYGSSSGKVVLEESFGESLAMATTFNTELETFSDPERIYRIDHYLRKEMIRNIQAIRFSNPIFTDVWNSRYIGSVQISALEGMGVETRGGYYGAGGVLKDMVQSHLFQILSIMAAGRPEEFGLRGLHDARLDVFCYLRPTDETSIESTLVLGQYGGYRDEPLVKPGSQTEACGALCLFIGSER